MGFTEDDVEDRDNSDKSVRNIGSSACQRRKSSTFSDVPIPTGKWFSIDTEQFSFAIFFEITRRTGKSICDESILGGVSLRKTIGILLFIHHQLT